MALSTKDVVSLNAQPAEPAAYSSEEALRAHTLLPLTPKPSLDSVQTNDTRELFFSVLRPVLPATGMLSAALLASFFPHSNYAVYAVGTGSILAAVASLPLLAGPRGFAWKKETSVSLALTLALILTTVATSIALLSQPLNMPTSVMLMGSSALFVSVALWTQFHSYFQSLLGRWISGLPEGMTGPAWKKSSLEAEAVRTPHQSLRIGDLCVCRKGDVVPSDGSIVRGSLVLHEREYSGLLQLRVRSAGDRVSAYSKVVNGEAVIRITAELQDARTTSFVAIISDAITAKDVSASYASSMVVHSIALAVLFAGVCEALVLRELHMSWPVALNATAAVIASMALIDCMPLLKALGILAVRRGFMNGVLFRTQQALTLVSQCRDLVIDFSSPKPPFTEVIRDFVIFDERIDRAALESAMLAIFSKNGTASAFESALTVPPQRLAAHSVLDIQRYSGGLIAHLESSEFSIGNEEFLIARGVKLQLSEVGSHDSMVETVYVAIGDAVVARFFLGAPNLVPFQKALSRASIGLRLWGTSPAEMVDGFGKKCGLELAQIAGGITTDQYLTKLHDARHASLFLSDGAPSEVIKSAPCTLSVFDSVRWDIERSDVVLFGEQEHVLLAGVTTARTYKLMKVFLATVVVISSGAALSLAACTLFTPASVLALSMLTIFACVFSADYAFIRTWKDQSASSTR